MEKLVDISEVNRYAYFKLFSQIKFICLNFKVQYLPNNEIEL